MPSGDWRSGGCCAATTWNRKAEKANEMVSMNKPSFQQEQAKSPGTLLGAEACMQTGGASRKWVKNSNHTA